MRRLKKILKRPDLLFALIASVCGFTWALLVPPFQVPDEIGHYHRSLEISYGQFLPNPLARQGGSVLPKNFDLLVDSLGSKDIRWDSSKKQDLGRLNSASRIPFGEWTFQKNDTSTWIYPPILYMPQAVGAFIATKAGLNMV
ncbi:MAG TPA: DUF2142 domain-containing protein, partial [Nitrospirota bacterium]